MPSNFNIYFTLVSVSKNCRTTGKQCRPRPDAAKCGVLSEATLLAKLVYLSTRGTVNIVFLFGDYFQRTKPAVN